MSVALAFGVGPGFAQDATAPPAGAAGAKAAAKPAAASAAKNTNVAATGDSGLRQRIEQLEEQIVDLQVVIGTLESLAKAPAASSAPRPVYSASPSGADTARLDTLETQIRALTQQLEQLSQEVRANRGTGSTASSAAMQVPEGSLRTDAATVPEAGARVSRTGPPPTDDPIAGMISEPLPDATNGSAPDSQVALASPSGEDAKIAYEAAYGQMLQQNYTAAQSGFSDFLKRNPGHALVPNALYWLGETYYVQRNYADAAEAFDIVLAAHSTSNKAPDSQLKKAMSLSQLGKNQDACSALKQLAAKYPNAPAHVKSKADSERRRVGCS